jgi:pimeloyl-ACP methyl ester carboxylesterase
MSLPIPRRGFVDVPGGQVHYREAGDGGARPLILLHPSPGSGKMLTPLLQQMAQTRRTLALDTRGNGDSTPLAGPEPAMAEFTAATLDAVDALGIVAFDLFGSHTGASIAMEVSIQAPDRVGRLILDSMGLWSPQRREDYLARNSPQVAPDLMGSQFNWAFHYCRDQYLFWPWYERTAEARRATGLPAPEILHEFVVEVLKSLASYHQSYRAAARHPKRDRLPLITVPTLVSSSPTDMLIQFLDEMAALTPGARKAVVADPETEAGAAIAAPIYAAFLDEVA